MEDLKKEIGKRIAESRKAKHLKQEDLRTLIDAPTVQMISGWEKGHSFPSMPYLVILAKTLDTSLDYLLLGKENGSVDRSIVTYKDAATRLIELEDSGLFEMRDGDYGLGYPFTELYTIDKTIGEFKSELDSLKGASKTLRPELYKQAIQDLLDKYDSPIKKPKEKLE